MGRKRWRRGGWELLVLFILYIHVIVGDGDVGEYDYSLRRVNVGKRIPFFHGELLDESLNVLGTK